MEVISLHETAAVQQEADRLCELLNQQAEPLRRAALGKTGLLRDAREGEISFELLQQGRNAVYRLGGALRWYLKLPCNGKPDSIAREVDGFRHVREVFRSAENYYHPAAVRASLKNAYLLMTEVPGTQLNYELYRRCFSPFGRRFAEILPVFRTTGEILARFHSAGQSFDGPPASRLADKLGRRLLKAKKLDGTGQKVADWFGKNRPFETEQTFIHGNCTFRNVLVQSNTISLLDFETAGRGSRYNDLARMCSDLLLTRVAVAFPWKRAYLALREFLAGYHPVFPVSGETLLRHLALYVFDRYVQVYCVKKSKETISGIPVSGTRLNWLIQRLLEGDGAAVFDGVPPFL